MEIGNFLRALEMSEQLDMMGEFCYGPDAFKNSGISHSYVRVSKEKTPWTARRSPGGLSPESGGQTAMTTVQTVLPLSTGCSFQYAFHMKFYRKFLFRICVMIY